MAAHLLRLLRHVVVATHGMTLRMMFDMCAWPEGAKAPTGLPRNASLRSVVLWADASGKLCMRPYERTLGSELGRELEGGSAAASKL